MNKENNKGKLPDEWIKQADYDMETARAMFAGRRYIYTVFMCHLSIEKALKGLYQTQTGEMPPKTHNLVFLVEKIGLKLSEDMYDRIFKLSRISIQTRYPEDLEKMQEEYNRNVTGKTLQESEDALLWIKKQYQK